MLQKIKLIGGIGIVAAAGIYALVADQRKIAEATERYSLTEAGQEFAKSCRSALDSNDQEFSSGRSTIPGCACVAAEMAKTYDEDLETAAIVMTAMVEMADEPANQIPDLAGIAERADISLSVLGEQIGVNMAAMSVCNTTS